MELSIRDAKIIGQEIADCLLSSPTMIENLASAIYSKIPIAVQEKMISKNQAYKDKRFSRTHTDEWIANNMIEINRVGNRYYLKLARLIELAELKKHPALYEKERIKCLRAMIVTKHINTPHTVGSRE